MYIQCLYLAAPKWDNLMADIWINYFVGVEFIVSFKGQSFIFESIRNIGMNIHIYTKNTAVNTE